MTPMPRYLAFFALLGWLLLSSCDSDGRAAAALGEVPDTVSEGFRQVTVSSTGRIEVESDRVETYQDRDITVFSGARMREFDAEGELRIDGRADLIEVDGDRNGRAEGGITVQDFSEDLRLEADQLEWDDGERRLNGTGPVSIASGDGLAVAGEGFQADLARESYVFTDGAEGTLELADDE